MDDIYKSEKNMQNYFERYNTEITDYDISEFIEE